MKRSDPKVALERWRRLWEARGRAFRRTVVVAGLGGLMGIAIVAWLLRSGPQISRAQGFSLTEQPNRLPERAKPVHLGKNCPVLPGRHDRIHRDFFRLSQDVAPLMEKTETAFAGETSGDFSALSPGQEVPRPMLWLQAIMVGTRPQALINDVIVSVGEKVKLISDASNDDEFDVTAIDDQTVSLTRGGKVIVLHLEPEDEGTIGGTGPSQ